MNIQTISVLGFLNKENKLIFKEKNIKVLFQETKDKRVATFLKKMDMRL